MPLNGLMESSTYSHRTILWKDARDIYWRRFNRDQSNNPLNFIVLAFVIPRHFRQVSIHIPDRNQLYYISEIGLVQKNRNHLYLFELNDFSGQNLTKKSVRECSCFMSLLTVIV